MNVEGFLPIVANFGPLGFVIWYLIWREKEERKDQNARFLARCDIEKAEIASRLDLAKSLTMLSMVIQGRADV